MDLHDIEGCVVVGSHGCVVAKVEGWATYRCWDLGYHYPRVVVVYGLTGGAALLCGRLGPFGSTGGSPSSGSFGGRPLPSVDSECSEITV